MDNLSAIAVVGKNREIGINDNLVWNLPGDLKFFQAQTEGKPVVMGSRTFASIKSSLPGRKRIVLSSRDLDLDPNILVIHSKEELLQFAKEYKEEIFIIGGAYVYKQFLEDVSKIVLTEVDAESKEANKFFPYFDKKEWQVVSLGDNQDNGISYLHKVYTRK